MKPSTLTTLAIFPLLLCGLYINSTPPFRLKLAEYYVKTENCDKAILIYGKILRKETLTDKHQMLKANDISDLRFTLANLFLKKKKFLESAQVLEKIKETNPVYKINFYPTLNSEKDCRRLGISLTRNGLNLLAIEQFKRSLELNPNNLTIFYYLGLIYLKRGMLDNAVDEFRKIVELYDHTTYKTGNINLDLLVHTYSKIGVCYEKEGNIEYAKLYYKKAIELDKNLAIIALNNLKAIYVKEANYDAINLIKSELINLNPKYEVNFKVDSGVIFLGYLMDKREFELFNKGQVVFIWQTNSNRIYEIKEIENLAPNFGFETNAVGEGFPDGWDSDIYSKSKTYRTPIESHEVVVKQKMMDDTQCLLLDNSLSRCTNCQTDYIAIDSDVFYLQAGWSNSAKGDGRIGGMWFDFRRHPILYSFIAKDLKLNKWQHHAQVVIPPRESKYYRLWVNNYENQGKLYFDDIFFIELEFPKSVQAN